MTSKSAGHGHIGLSEFARMMGFSKQRASKLIEENPDFPEPADRLGTGRIWHTADVEAWIAETGPRPPGVHRDKRTQR